MCNEENIMVHSSKKEEQDAMKNNHNGQEEGEQRFAVHLSFDMAASNKSDLMQWAQAAQDGGLCGEDEAEPIAAMKAGHC